MLGSWLTGRRLVLRSIVLLFLGLVLLGIILDHVLQTVSRDQVSSVERQWLPANFALLGEQLAAAEAADWPRVLESFQQRFAVRAEIYKENDIAMPQKLVARLHAGELVEVFSAGGQPQYFQKFVDSSETLATESRFLSISSIVQASDGFSLRWLSYLYYFFVFCLLLWWLRPLVKDIHQLNTAAERLGQDVHAEAPELTRVSELTVLSNTFQKMAQQIRNMLVTQKEMTNALSHELRTPLARVKFGLAVLEKEVETNVSEDLAHIRADINEFDALVDRMLNYARLDDPAANLQLQDIETQPWLGELCSKARASQRGLQCTIHVQAAAEQICADPELLGLAFSNLFANAMRYAARNIDVYCNATADSWELRVEDDGPGVPVEQREDIFKAFKRLDESRDRVTGGHGLGLAIVARIATLHGGSCSVDQSLAGGACFAIRWPAAVDIR